jgi:hypothetical protein
MSTRMQTQVKAAPKPSFTPVQGGLLQRKCACGGVPSLTGECEECRKKRLTSQHRSDDRAEPSTVPPTVQKVLQSPGQPLDADTRAFMEPRFGHDFSRVRVHSGAAAEQSARDVNAHAYTVGHDIVFNTGRFAPGTHQGRRLIAHELAHTLQQPSPNLARASEIDAVDSAAERQAEAVGDALAAGRAPGPIKGARDTGSGILRRQRVTLDNCGEFSAEPLSPKQWRWCVAQGKIDPGQSYPLRFTESGEVATPDRLIAWAFREGLTEKTVLQRFNSHAFSGTAQAWTEAKAALAEAFSKKSLETRKTERSEEEELRAATDALKQQQDEAAKTLEMVKIIVEDYYKRGEKLKPVGSTLVPIEEAAEAEKRGRSAGRIWNQLRQVSYYRGQKGGRFTVVSPSDLIVKVNDRYYYQVDEKTMYDVIHGIVSFSEQVWENTKGVNVAYGYLVKGVGHVASLMPNTLGQMMGPMMTTAGEGMHYDVRRLDARKAGEEFNQPAPEIGAKTLVEGAANVAGGKFGMGTGKWVGKYAPRTGAVIGVGTGMYTSSIVVKSYEAVQGNITWKEVFLPPDASPVEILVSMVEARLLHKFSERWTKGRAPKVPADVNAPPPGKVTSLPQVKEGSDAPTAGAKPSVSPDIFQPVPKGVSATLDKARARFSEHDLEVTREGFQLCSPGPCPLVRKVYKRELKDNEQLATLLDDLELQRRANPKDSALRKKSLILEERLGELKARNELLDAIPEADVRNRARAVVEVGVGLDRQQVSAFAKSMRGKKSPTARARLVKDLEELALRANIERNRQRMQGVDRATDADVERAFEAGKVESKTPGKTSGTTAPKQDPTAQDIGANIDEILPVGDKLVSIAERQRRALDLNNREFKDPLTNQRTKHVKIDKRDLARLGKIRKPISLKMQEIVKGEVKPKTGNEYLALWVRRFSEIIEVKAVGERIVQDLKTKTNLRPGELKAELNRRMWDEFRNPTTPEGKIVAEAIQRSGFGIVQAPNGQAVVRALTQSELKARGLRYVKGQGWVPR